MSKKYIKVQTGRKSTAFNMAVDPSEHRFWGLGPGDLVHHPSLPQQDQSRNAPNPEPATDIGVFLGIDLHHRRATGQSPRHFPHRRCEIYAVWSPGCPELRQDRCVVGPDKVVEIPFGKRSRLMIEGRQGSPTIAAAAGQAFLFGWNPVASPTGWTLDPEFRHTHLNL
jgi:hypothetical protein